MTSLTITHRLLVDGPDFTSCCQRVERFFARTILVKYDSVRIDAAQSCAATDPRFWEKVEQGLTANRETVADLLAELKASGTTALDDLGDLPQGYASKTLHTLAHLLDGFIGIDSNFYNLIDDSHWLSDQQRGRIKAAPAAHWLLSVEASSFTGNADQVATLRTTPTEKE